MTVPDDEATPEAPQGVRIVRRDGIEIPCEVRYVGRSIDEDGEPMDDWEAVTEVPWQIHEGDTMRIDMMPARSGISIPVDARGI